MWSRIVVAVTLVVSAVVQAGAAHSHEPGSSAGVASSRSAAPPPEQRVYCPSAYPVALEVRAETLAELTYLDQIDACTNAGRTALYLRNRSAMVWRPTTSGGSASVYGQSSDSTTFATFLGHPYPLLVPGDDLVVTASPYRVSWTFEIGMSAAWEARSYLYDWALSYGLSATFNLPRLRVGSAVATCLVAVRSAVDARKAAIANGWMDAMPFVSQVLSTGVGATRCGQGLRRVAEDYRVPVPSYVRNLTSGDVTRLARLDSQMSKMLRAQRVLQQALLAFF